MGLGSYFRFFEEPSRNKTFMTGDDIAQLNHQIVVFVLCFVFSPNSVVSEWNGILVNSTQ